MDRSRAGRMRVVLVALVTLAAGLVFADTSAASAPAACFEDPDLDVGLVLDRSGSMGGDRIATAKDGAQNMTERLDSGDLSGLVSYASSARLDQSLTSNHSATSQAIENLSAGGSTATGDGIDLSHQDLEQNGRTNVRDAMIVLTDGFTNRGLDPVTEAREAKNAGIEVFSIGVGDNINEAELREIASDPEEIHFHHAQTTEEIETVFSNITDELTAKNDTEPPTVGINKPQEGHLYLDGVDQGPGTGLDPDRATVLGDLTFEAQADDNCYLHHVDLRVPGASFSYRENATTLTTPVFPASDLEPGTYTLVSEAVDWVGLNATDRVDLRIPRVGAESRVVSLWAGAPTPESVEYRSHGVHLRDPGMERHTAASLDNADPPVEVEGLREEGTVHNDGEARTQATGLSRIAEVRLLDGLVEARGLTLEANVSWNLSERTSSIHAERFEIAQLVVAGEPVPVNASQGPVEVELPGGGFLRLFERHVRSGPAGIQYNASLLHLYAPDAYGGGEIILGNVFLETDTERTPQRRTIAEQDDARSGRDAGGPGGEPVSVEPGLYDGTFDEGDLVDRYAFQARHGEKIKFNLEPAKRARLAGGSAAVVEGSPSATGPEATAELPVHRLALYDPDGDLRALTLLFYRSFAQSVELNADVNGTWIVEIERLDEFGDDPDERFDEERYSHYSFDLTLTPVPLLPQNDALSGADAPARCEGDTSSIPTISTGQWEGVLRDGDFSDVYRLQADVGDLVTATVKPGETRDGVAMDLYLYNDQCQVLEHSSLGGTHAMKGLPELVTELPSDYTGTYYLRIERVNGVGNHHLTLSVRDPMPGLPTNDAGTGEDASNDSQDPTPAPDLVFQGTLTDGDERDAYALDLTAGQDAYVVFEGSALSRFEVDLFDPSGDRLPAARQVEEGTYVWSFQPEQTGDHVLVVEPDVGGGDYLVSWGQTPVPVPAASSSAGLPGETTVGEVDRLLHPPPLQIGVQD